MTYEALKMAIRIDYAAFEEFYGTNDLNLAKEWFSSDDAWECYQEVFDTLLYRKAVNEVYKEIKKSELQSI